MKHVIYGLYDPRKETEIRYVGYTSKGIERRLWEHINEAGKKDTIVHRLNWLRSLSNAGIKPSIIILEEVTKDNWQEREKFWITQFDNLVNSTDGGEGLINPSQYVRDKISIKVTESLQGNERRKGVAHTEESRKAISEGLKNSEKKKASDKSRIGIDPHANLSDEQKEVKSKKISEARLNCPTRIFSDEARKNMSNGHTGLVHPESAREKKRGSRFINNGFEMKQIKKDELLPEGWQFGMLKRTQQV